MATTEQFLSGNGATPLGFTTEYINESDIKVRVNGGNPLTFTTSSSPSTGEYHIPTNGTAITFGDNYGGSDVIHVYRETDFDNPLASFTAGSSIKAADLNLIHKAARFGAQEARQQIITPNLRDQQVTSAKIKDATIVDADISGSAAIAHTKIATGTLPSGIQVNSANIVDGSIVNDDVSNSANIAGSKLADDSVALTKLGSGALPTDITVSGNNVVNRSIKEEDIEVGALDNRYYTETELDAGQLDNRYYTETQLDAGQLDNRYFTETELTTGGVIDSRYYTENELDAGQLDNRYYTESELNGGQLNNLYFTESEITGGAADGRYYTETELDAGQLDNRYFTETELTGGALDGRYYTETEAEALFLRQDSSETIASGDTWSNTDSKVATTAAINARIIDLIDDVGGFTVIANENSFPNSNPQGTAGQSAILSIGAVTTTLTPSSGTVTLANGRLNNGQVLITGVTSAIPQGFGLLVESTSTDHTYAFHRLVPKATEVTTVASNITNIAAAGANVADINNFADLYQISSNAPTQRVDGTALQDGDLWFDNSNDNLRVYDGTNWAVISPNQNVLNDIAIVSGAITYQEDLGLISDAVTTGSSNGSLDIVADILEDEATFTVTAATGKFIIDGVDKPALTLYKGWTYTFDVSDASNANHPLRFQSGGSAYSTNVTVTGTQGQAGAKVVIKIPESQPTSFQYYCTNHSGMGNTITVKDDPIKTVSDSITNINAVAGNSTNINAVANNATNINTVASSESNINRYADEYVIQSGAPSSPSAGDLWFSTTANVLNFYNGTAWVGISPGIAGLINDANPALANHLDCNDKNLTEVATISGNNLQLDFGTL